MKPFFRSLFDSETAFKRVVRAALMGIGALLSAGTIPQLLPYKDWGALLVALGAIIPAGEMNTAP